MRDYTRKDPHEDVIEYNVKKFEDLSDGVFKTDKDYADEAAALDPEQIYKPRPFSNVKKDYVTTHDSLAQRTRKDVPPNILPNVDVENEDWTGTKYVTSHACHGKPCNPDAHPYAFEPRKATTHDSLVQRGDVPPNVRPNIDIEKEDDTGTHWATTHRRYGKPPAQNKPDEDGHVPVLWNGQQASSLAQRRDVPPNVAPNIDVDKEDDTGTKYGTTHRRFGKPPSENKPDSDGHVPVLWNGQKTSSLVQLDRRYDGPSGLPWEDNDFFERNDADMNLNVKRFNEAQTFKTQKALHDKEREDAKAWEEKINTVAFEVPKNIMEADDTGTKYATTHRCYGEKCAEKPNTKYQRVDYLQLEESQPIGDFERERDEEAGYPHEWKELKDTREYVREYIDPANGRLKSPFEVEGERYEKEMKKLQEARDTKKFTVPDEMINDWPGDRFHTTHRCFGGPCKGDKPPTAKDTQFGLGWSEANYLQTDAPSAWDLTQTGGV
jgi:hypothetical protein